jgi:hypothetical protein
MGRRPTGNPARRAALKPILRPVARFTPIGFHFVRTEIILGLGQV